MCLRERPGVPDHLRQVSLPRLPAELRADPLAGGDELRRIAGPTRCFTDWDLAAGDLLSRIDHLAHREAAAVAEVEDQVLSWSRSLEREQMCNGEILDVDVIANGCSVRW